MLYKIYCDETCHLEHDTSNVMVIGSVWCPQHFLNEINKRIVDIKLLHGISRQIEIKWTKLSNSKVQLYKDLVNYFFDNDNLHFRAVIIDKEILDFKLHNLTSNDFYYRIYFDMLKVIFDPNEQYEIYSDIKDSHSHQHLQKLKEVCSNQMYDFSGNIIRRFQPIRSEEIQIMQLVDILIGAIAYRNRNFPIGEHRNEAKQNVIKLIQNRSRYSLDKTTLYKEDKVNLLKWVPRE